MFHFMRGRWGWDAWDKELLVFWTSPFLGSVSLAHPSSALCQEGTGWKVPVRPLLSPWHTHPVWAPLKSPAEIWSSTNGKPLTPSPTAPKESFGSCFRRYVSSRMLFQWGLEEVIILACRAITDKWLIEQEAINYLLTNMLMEMSLPHGAMKRGGIITFHR